MADINQMQQTYNESERPLVDQDLAAIAEVLVSAQEVLIFPHILMDGDAMGSAVALCAALRNLGKDAWIVVEDKIPEYLAFMDRGYTLDIKEWGQLERRTHEVCLCIDCNDVSRFPKRADLFRQGTTKICIDHHVTDSAVGDISYIDPEAAATGEIVFDLLLEMGVLVTKEIAGAIFAAITTDTGKFQYSNTTAHSHEVVIALYDSGFNATRVSNELYENQRPERMKLHGALMEEMEIFADGAGVIAVLTQDMLRRCGALMEDSEGAIGNLRSIHGVEIAVLLKETEEGEIKASFRSKNRGDVAAICRKFHGGGHLRAAGCTLRDMTLEEAVAVMKKEVEEGLALDPIGEPLNDEFFQEEGVKPLPVEDLPEPEESTTAEKAQEAGEDLSFPSAPKEEPQEEQTLVGDALVTPAMQEAFEALRKKKQGAREIRRTSLGATEEAFAEALQAMEDAQNPSMQEASSQVDAREASLDSAHKESFDNPLLDGDGNPRGILNVYKPQEYTSFDCVAIVRRQAGVKRVGHTGTLDPMATGVLPVCIGSATRIVEYLDADIKEYVTTMKLGIETDTCDIWGNVLRENKVVIGQNLPEGIVRRMIFFMQGELEQTPPMYSAIKVDGRKLYDYARAGEEVEVKPRNVTVHSIQILDIREDEVDMRVTCSKGTYIRSLCRDIGTLLGCGATMAALERTSSGLFDKATAVNIEDVKAMSREELLRHLVPMDQALGDLVAVRVTPEDGAAFRNGRPLPGSYVTAALREQSLRSAHPWKFRIYTGQTFLGVADFTDGKLKAHKVLEQ